VHALNAIARRLYELNIGRPEIATRDVVRQLLKESAGEGDAQKFSLHFLTTEWEDVVDAWQLGTWEAYRDVARLGRKTRLPEKQRQTLWAVFERVRAGLKSRGLVTYSDLLSQLASHLATVRQPPFDFAVVDEAQDVSVAQLRFLAALGAGQPNSLFFAGDLGQRIFQQPSRGEHSALIFAAVPERSASTTERRIRSGRKPTSCWGRKSPTLTATRKTGVARSPYSTGPSLSSRFWTRAKPRGTPSAAGSRIAWPRG
jgi:hypothetical protein